MTCEGFSNDKRVRKGDLQRTLIDLAITDRRVGLKEGDMLTGLTKSQLKLMIRLIYEGQDEDDDALAEKNISADE